MFFDEERLDADVLDVPDDVVGNLRQLQQEFFRWLFDKSNDHPYWYYRNGEKYGCCYRGEAFVYWLNNCYLGAASKTALLVEQWAERVDCTRPELFM